MSSTRLIAVGCTLAFAVAAMTAAPAGATGWDVNGTTLVGSAALATTANVEQENEIVAVGVSITCTGAALNAVNAGIEASNKGSATALEFKECSANGNTCSLENSTIKTRPLSLEATQQGAIAVVTKFKPKTGTLLSEITFEGTECSLAGVQPLTGTVKALAPTGQEERTWQLIEAGVTAASGELKLGPAAALFNGAASFKLASQKGWGLGTKKAFGGLDGGTENLEKSDEKAEKITFTVPGLPFINVVVGAANLMYLRAPEGYREAFKIVKNTCEGLIEAFKECGIEISFTPKGKGRYLSDLLVPVREDGGTLEEIQRVMLIFNV